MSEDHPPTSENSAGPEAHTGWSSGMVMVIAAATLALGFGWGRQSGEPSNPTTTAPTTTTGRADESVVLSALRGALDADDVAAIRALALAYEALDRTLDNTERAGVITLAAAIASRDQDLIKTASDALTDELDGIDHSAIQVAGAGHDRLQDQLDRGDWSIIRYYLSGIRLSPSDHDAVIGGFGWSPNMTELDAILDAL